MYRDQPGNLQGILRDHLLYQNHQGRINRDHQGKNAATTQGKFTGTTREHIQGPPRDYSLYSTRTEPRRDHLLFRDQPGNLPRRDHPGNIYRDHQKTIADTIQDKFTGNTADVRKCDIFVDFRFAAQCFFAICDLRT